MATTQGRQIFMGNGIFKVPANVTRVRVIADCTAFSRFACDKAASYLLDANGQLWAWGLNTLGQLGINNTTVQSSPVAVVGGQKFVNFWIPKTSAYSQAFAIDQNGQLYSWGSNTGLNLGQNQGAGAFACSSPILVAGSGVGVGKTQYANLFPGFGQMMALDVNGNLWGWGTNSLGQLGNGTNTPTGIGAQVSSPTLVVGGIHWQLAECENGSGTTFGIDTDNNLWAWGANGGMLGIGALTPTQVSSPVKVVGGLKWRKVMSAPINTNYGIGIPGPIAFGLDFQGRVWSWGNNTYGQAGIAFPYQTVNSSPTLVSFPAGVQIRDIAAATSASNSDSIFYGLDYNGNIWAWGMCAPTLTNSGSFGNGNFNSTNLNGSSTPTLVMGGHNFNKIFTKLNPSLGTDFVFAQDAGGGIWGWGNNGNGLLGNNNGTLNVSIPTAISGNNRFIWLDWDTANSGPVFACDFFGQLWSWSWNQIGAAGNGTGVNSITTSSPIQVLLQKVVQMNNPQQDYFFDVVPGQSIPVIFGGLYTQFADKLVGPVPHTNLPQSASATAASPLTLIANRVIVEYDQ